MIRQLAAVVVMAGALTACSGGQDVTRPSASALGGIETERTTPSAMPSALPPVTPAPSVSPLGSAQEVRLAPAPGEWKDAVQEKRAGLTSVVALGPADAWAAGWANDGTEGLVEHWDGRRWSKVTPPSGRRVALSIVSASPGGEVWVFEWKGDAWRRDGDGWAEMGALAGLSSLRAAVVTGSGEVLVAGFTDTTYQTPIFGRWSKGRWSVLPAPFRIQSLSAASGQDVWAVGTDESGGLSAARWNGERWRSVPLPAGLRMRAGAWLRVDAVSPREVWAAGTLSETPSQPSADGFALRWNGRAWQLLKVPFLTRKNAFRETGVVAADGRGGVWLVEDYGRVWHYDGRGWGAEDGLSSSDAKSVNDIAAVPGGRRAIAVGDEPLAEDDGDAWIWMWRPTSH
ncbi:hypothetical protein J5X84_15425 [Streptosporangiaceae bacterium NEAU-GS5]|nr:hypothetical protein [Streptosporangiaceae bacterium NEAU-GS5]